MIWPPHRTPQEQGPKLTPPPTPLAASPAQRHHEFQLGHILSCPGWDNTGPGSRAKINWDVERDVCVNEYASKECRA